MHRTNRMSWRMVGGMLLTLVLGGLTALAQEQVQPPVPGKGGASPAIIVPITGTQRLKMTTGKNIARATNPNEAVARVSPVVDRPAEVNITGLEPGITRITLVDVDGREETYEVIVQMDVEYLRNLLRRGVPTANVQITPGA